MILGEIKPSVCEQRFPTICMASFCIDSFDLPKQITVYPAVKLSALHFSTQEFP
jgi:hypothetical protein